MKQQIEKLIKFYESEIEELKSQNTLSKKVMKIRVQERDNFSYDIHKESININNAKVRVMRGIIGQLENILKSS